MTIEQLIKQLQKIKNKNRLVVMSKDGEGNGYSPLNYIEECAYEYEEDTPWSGSIGLEKLSKKDIADGYSEEDVIKDGVPAVCLQPIN